MNREEILAKLKPLIADSLNVNESEVVPEAILTTDLHADSLDAVDTIMIIEKEFDIAITDADMEKLTTVKSIVDYIEQHTKS